MKKILKVGIKVLPVVLMIMLVLSPMVFAADIISTSISSSGTSTQTKIYISKIWDIVKMILQIAAIAAIIFSGVKYMFASADQKAEVKKSLGILALGAFLVFGATIFIDIILKIAEDIKG